MNPVVVVANFFGPKIYKPSLILAAVIIITWPIDAGFFQFFFFFSAIALSSIIIWRAGDHFSPAAEFIEEHHNLPQSVKAAVIDAVASSFPEFAVAMIAVIFLGRFDVGVATIAGSALYNVLVIPAAAGLVAATPLVVSREVVWRDSLFYLMVVAVLIGTVMMFTEWSIGIASLFFFIYVAYVILLHRHYKSHQKKTSHQEQESPSEEEEEEELHINTEKEAWSWIVGMMLLMGGASHALVEASIGLGNLLGIDAVIMAFVVIAAGTSAPDTALSVLSAQRGNYDAAVSNVFGSNIFDICICLSVPIALMFFGGSAFTLMEMEHISLLWLLLLSTLIAIYFFYSNNYTLTKSKSILMLALYLAIVLYSLVLATGVFG
ncbi:MAG: sodium:calcium antiporter [SAR324 cluster bacterium]|nr:sodium:calcium antiporter [SAR324 cluster bacterium]